MNIHVEMTAEEFQEFMSWRADKKCYDDDLQKVDAKLEHVFNKILWALETNSTKPGKAKIINQEHAAELVDMATDWFS